MVGDVQWETMDDDGRAPEDAYTVNSSCEPNGISELNWNCCKIFVQSSVIAVKDIRKQSLR